LLHHKLVDGWGDVGRQLLLLDLKLFLLFHLHKLLLLLLGHYCRRRRCSHRNRIINLVQGHGGWEAGIFALGCVG